MRMPRFDELACSVNMLESKVEYMMSQVIEKLDMVYEVSQVNDASRYETELLRQEVGLLRARLCDFERRLQSCTCDQKRGTCSDETRPAQPGLWNSLHRLRKGYMKQTVTTTVDVKSIISKFEISPEHSRPTSCPNLEDKMSTVESQPFINPGITSPPNGGVCSILEGDHTKKSKIFKVQRIFKKKK